MTLTWQTLKRGENSSPEGYLLMPTICSWGSCSTIVLVLVCVTKIIIICVAINRVQKMETLLRLSTLKYIFLFFRSILKYIFLFFRSITSATSTNLFQDPGFGEKTWLCAVIWQNFWNSTAKRQVAVSH